MRSSRRIILVMSTKKGILTTCGVCRPVVMRYSVNNVPYFALTCLW